MNDDSPDPALNDAAAFDSALRRRLGLAKRALYWQRLWPAVWPVAAVIGGFAILALFDIPDALPPWLHVALLLAFAGGLAVAIYRTWRQAPLPSEGEAQRYLEDGSGIVHRPVTAIRDRLASGKGQIAGETLWAIHRARMRRAAERLTVRWPQAGWISVDPWGLRAGLGVLFVTAMVVAGDQAPARLARAFLPDLSGGSQPPKLDIWITPPSYTGVAPIFLSHGPQDRRIAVPQDSVLTAQVSDGRGTPRIALGSTVTLLQETGKKLWRAEIPVRDGDRIVVTQGRTELGAWAMTMIADQPPAAKFSGPPRRTVRSALRLDFEASDDYGLAELKARLTLVPREGAAPRPDKDDAIELDLTGNVVGLKEVKTSTYHDLTPHPWAGLPVEYRLQVKDAAGQVSESEPIRAELPERSFNHPIARAMIEQRKRLVSEPEQRRDIATKLWGIGNLPHLYGDDLVIFLALRSAANRLVLNEGDRATAEVQGLIWDAALRLEDGEVSLAERELRDLRRQLQEALNRNAPDDEIRRLIERIREAIDRYLDALARAPQPTTPEDMEDMDDTPGEIITRDDLQRMLQQMQRLSETGARDSARQMLERLAQMLENLRAMRPNQARQARQGDTQQMMRRLEELARQQQRLLDQTFRQSREANSETQWLRGSQDELRRELGNLMRMLGDRLGQIPQALGDADQAMRDALRALGEGNAGQAVGPQTQALDRLRQGVGQALRQLSGQGGEDGDQPGGEQQATGPEDDMDPLGRETDGRGNNVDGHVAIPSESDLTRSRQILDELRRRAADPWRPPVERDYIDRLLERF